jgi:hypothetical protein
MRSESTSVDDGCSCVMISIGYILILFLLLINFILRGGDGESLLKLVGFL